MSDFSDRLRTLVHEGRSALATLAPAARTVEPAPSKWSPIEVLGHLVDSASNNHQRFVRAQFTETLVFSGYDQDAWVRTQWYLDADWDQLVELWASFNLHIAHVMDAIDPEIRGAPRAEHNLDEIAWRTVPRDESTTLEYFMRDYVGHLEHHLRPLIDRASA